MKLDQPVPVAPTRTSLTDRQPVRSTPHDNAFMAPVVTNSTPLQPAQAVVIASGEAP
jgi:hypothetical protein